MGAERCVQILFNLGADIERPNEFLDLPVEIAMAEAALDSTRLPLLFFLHLLGARIDLAGRQASRQCVFLDRFGSEVPAQQVSSLGWIGLRELSNEWHGAQPFESPDQEVIQAALRLDSARRTLGLGFEDFLPVHGSAFLCALQAHHLPVSLGLCLHALHEPTELGGLPDFKDAMFKAPTP